MLDRLKHFEMKRNAITCVRPFELKTINRLITELHFAILGDGKILHLFIYIN